MAWYTCVHPIPDEVASPAMSKQHTFYWILAAVVLVVAWAVRKAIVRSGELRARTQQREEEFLTQFPDFAGGPDLEQRRSR